MFNDDSVAKKGFTLIELMVVITIVGLLASMVLAGLSVSQKNARDTVRVNNVKELQKALELYRNANGGNYPCATVMPGCVSGGYGISVNGLAPISNPISSEFNTAVGSFFNFPKETINFTTGTLTEGSVLYRTGGATNSPVLDSYTVLLRREQSYINSAGETIAAGAWCAFRVGTNQASAWPVATYKNCL